MLQKGYLLISDISGYTAFLTQAELDHAHDIMQNLMKLLLDNLTPPIHVSKLEGDAIFCYTLDGSFHNVQTLLETIETVYCKFTRAKELMHVNTTCTCKACTLIPTLDLKFVAHHGEFIISTIGKNEELTGPDVILVHRLLKSTIKEATEVEAYAFFSEKCNLGDLALGMKPHAENYEHVGDVKGYVHDLKPIWEQRKDSTPVGLTPETAHLIRRFTLPVSVAQAWDYLTTPDHIKGMLNVKAISFGGQDKGRVSSGSTMHCAHGDGSTTMQVVDWKPLDQFTLQFELPFGLGKKWYMTWQVKALDQGTEVILMTSKMDKGNFVKQPLGLMAGKMMMGMNFKNGEKYLKQLAENQPIMPVVLALQT
jgi:hypothetical protein